MDPEKKAQALISAQGVVDAAKAKLSTAQAKLQAAQEAKDDAATTAAQGEVTSAQGELTAAEAAVTKLQGSADELADELLGDDGKLADGTDPKKKIEMPFDKFQDLNEKAKLLEQFAPVLAKLQKDPKLVEKLMAGDNPEASIADRLSALEQRETASKKAEIRDVITKAITLWPDFRAKWDEIKPLVTGMEAAGIKYADAVQRAYFAVNPDAVKKQERLVQLETAKERENARGKGSMGGGGGPIVHNDGDEAYNLNEADLEFARKTGIDPKLYAKHAGFIEKFADL